MCRLILHIAEVPRDVEGLQLPTPLSPCQLHCSSLLSGREGSTNQSQGLLNVSSYPNGHYHSKTSQDSEEKGKEKHLEAEDQALRLMVTWQYLHFSLFGFYVRSDIWRSCKRGNQNGAYDGAWRSGCTVDSSVKSLAWSLWPKESWRFINLGRNLDAVKDKEKGKSNKKKKTEEATWLARWTQHDGLGQIQKFGVSKYHVLVKLGDRLCSAVSCIIAIEAESGNDLPCFGVSCLLSRYLKTISRSYKKETCSPTLIILLFAKSITSISTDWLSNLFVSVSAATFASMTKPQQKHQHSKYSQRLELYPSLSISDALGGDVKEQ